MYKEYQVRVSDNGDRHWFLNDKLHREDGPAIEYADSHKEWYFNGKCHRENGPAVEYADGTKHWYLNGMRHREGGPAVECSNGAKIWWLHGKQVPQNHIIEIDGKKYKLVSTDG